MELLSKTEGIIPTLESSQAVAYLMRESKNFKKNDCIMVTLSGRGDKDLQQLFENNLLNFEIKHE